MALSLNKQKEKDWDTLIKQIAKTNGWKFKPLIIDEVFWEIVGLEDIKKMPLSFRGNGAFVIRSKNVFDFNLKVIPENLNNDINNIFANINSQVDKLQSTISDLDSFVKYLEQNPDSDDEWFDFDLIIMASIIQKKYDKVLSLLDYAKKEDKDSSYGFGDKDFYDLARAYCQRKL